MKDKELNNPTLTIQEEKEIAIEILKQHLHWQMATPPSPEEIPILELIGPVQKSKRRMVRKLLRKQLWHRQMPGSKPGPLLSHADQIW